MKKEKKKILKLGRSTSPQIFILQTSQPADFSNNIIGLFISFLLRGAEINILFSYGLICHQYSSIFYFIPKRQLCDIPVFNLC